MTKSIEAVFDSVTLRPDELHGYREQNSLELTVLEPGH